MLAVAMVASGFGTSFTLTGATARVMGAATAGYAGTASAALGLGVGIPAFMVIGAAGYLVGVLLTARCVPRRVGEGSSAPAG